MSTTVKVPYEQRSIMNALETYLTSKGWSGITYTDNSGEETIANPQISVKVQTGSPTALQLGKSAGQDLLYRRTLNINAYMETEPRANAIVDTIIEFIEFMCPDIVDPVGTVHGYVRCVDDERILGQVFPPIMNDPKLIRYRAAVNAPIEAFYPNG